MKKRGFISYIHEEASVAEYIRDFAGDFFRGELDLFVSFLDIYAGDWLQQIRLALEGTSYVFPLLSFASRTRPWVSFESGAAFGEEQAQLIPLCHRGLNPGDLRPPFSHFQAYDLSKPSQVDRLIRYLASELDVLVEQFASQQFCERIRELDELDYRFTTSLEQLRSTPELADVLDDSSALLPIKIAEVDVWDDLELRARVHDDFTMELNGHTRESTGCSIHNIEVPDEKTHLVVKLMNTDESISNDRERMLIVAIGRQRIYTAVQAHRHFADSQYIVKGDGMFAFRLPELAKRSSIIRSIHFSFWRIDIRNLLMELFLV